jgi:hypothetical protein
MTKSQMARSERAKELMAQGKVFAASIVKSHYNSSYYNVVRLADVAATGEWPAAPIGRTASGATCRLGDIGSSIDWAITHTGKV